MIQTWALHYLPSFNPLCRNNVLHLWPWVIEDLKSLGAKNFYPRFCTGTMNHISIRSLQHFFITNIDLFLLGGFSVSCLRLPWSLVLRYLAECLLPTSRSRIMTTTSGGYLSLQKNIQCQAVPRTFSSELRGSMSPFQGLGKISASLLFLTVFLQEERIPWQTCNCDHCKLHEQANHR